MTKGVQILEQYDEKFQRIGSGQDRPPVWVGGPPWSDSEVKSEVEKKRLQDLGIPEIKGGPKLLLHGLSNKEKLTVQEMLDVLQSAFSTETRFMMGVSGCGKTRTIFEFLSRNIGLYLTLKPEQNLGSGDFSEMIKLLRFEMGQLTARRAMHDKKPEHSTLEDLRPESQDWVRLENRQKAETYMRVLMLARLIVLKKVLEYATVEFEEVDWLYAQLNWDSTREKDRDFFKALFLIYAEGSRDDVERELKSVQAVVFRLLAERFGLARAFCFMDELQEVMKDGWMGFMSSQDPHRETHLLSVIVSEWEPAVVKGEATVRWQKVASGSGLRMTNFVTAESSMTAKGENKRKSIGEYRYLTDFKCFDSLEAFEGYLIPLVGENREGLLSALYEEAYGWFQGRARLTSDLAEKLLLLPESPPEEIIHALKEWHMRGIPLERVGDSLFDLISRFLLTHGDRRRHNLLNGRCILNVLESVVEQWVTKGEHIAVNSEEDLLLIDAGFARISHATTAGAQLTARVVEPLAVAAALEVLSKEQGWEAFVEKLNSKRMHVMLTRPSILGFLWESCAYNLIKRWLSKPLSALRQDVFGGRELDPVFNLGGEVVSFRIDAAGKLEETKRQPKEKVAWGSKNLTLADWLRDSKGTLYLHPEESAGPDLVCLVRFGPEGPGAVYKLLLVQLKLRYEVDNWKRVLATVRPEWLYSLKDGSKGDKWRRKRRREVLGIMKKHFEREKGILQLVLMYPYVAKDAERKAAYTAGECAADVMGVVDGSAGEAVWGDQLAHLNVVKPPSSSAPLRSIADENLEGEAESGDE